MEREAKDKEIKILTGEETRRYMTSIKLWPDMQGFMEARHMCQRRRSEFHAAICVPEGLPPIKLSEVLRRSSKRQPPLRIRFTELIQWTFGSGIWLYDEPLGVAAQIDSANWGAPLPTVAKYLRNGRLPNGGSVSNLETPLDYLRLGAGGLKKAKVYFDPPDLRRRSFSKVLEWTGKGSTNRALVMVLTVAFGGVKVHQALDQCPEFYI